MAEEPAGQVLHLIHRDAGDRQLDMRLHQLAERGGRPADPDVDQLPESVFLVGLQPHGLTPEVPQRARSMPADELLGPGRLVEESADPQFLAMRAQVPA